MKVSTVKPEFQPVVITLETQEEVDQMYVIVKNNSFGGVSDITLKLSVELSGLKLSDYEQKDSVPNRFYKVEK